jgi:hypothetical protein
VWFEEVILEYVVVLLLTNSCSIAHVVGVIHTPMLKVLHEQRHFYHSQKVQAISVNNFPHQLEFDVVGPALLHRTATLPIYSALSVHSTILTEISNCTVDLYT